MDDTNTHGSRTLAPRSETAESSASHAALQAQGNRSKKKVTSACLECRRARSKCSSSRPCARCQTLNVECIFNEGGDLRRRETRERRANQLAQQQQMLEHLLQFLRQRSQIRVNELISVVKHTDSKEDIHEWLRRVETDEAPLIEQTPRTESLELVESMSASSSSPPDNTTFPPRRHMLSLSELTKSSRSRDEPMG